MIGKRENTIGEVTLYRPTTPDAERSRRMKDIYTTDKHFTDPAILRSEKAMSGVTL